MTDRDLLVAAYRNRLPDVALDVGVSVTALVTRLMRVLRDPATAPSVEVDALRARVARQRAVRTR
ncbi:hypothetical protein ACRPLL_19445 [Bacillus velezensis]|uniref:hypothetical protein n=1 Tax=Bacillus velezensis TaxID=492670 RepID=UPI003D76BBF9